MIPLSQSIALTGIRVVEVAFILADPDDAKSVPGVQVDLVVMAGAVQFARVSVRLYDAAPSGIVQVGADGAVSTGQAAIPNAYTNAMTACVQGGVAGLDTYLASSGAVVVAGAVKA